MIIDLAPNRAKTGPARLLDMVEGHSTAVFKQWLAARPKHWRDAIDVVAMNEFARSNTAVHTTSETASSPTSNGTGSMHCSKLLGSCIR